MVRVGCFGIGATNLKTLFVFIWTLILFNYTKECTTDYMFYYITNEFKHYNYTYKTCTGIFS